MRSVMRLLRPVDALVIVFLFLLSIIILLFTQHGPVVMMLVGANILSCIIIVVLARFAHTTGHAFLRGIFHWYPVPTIFLVFKETYAIIQSIGASDWDTLLIAIDRTVFGTNPTVWLSQYSAPIITEILQIAYTSYYFIMLAVGVEVFMRKEKEKFSFALFTVLYGFFLSYLGYLIFPAVGPRFTLHNFNSLNAELPGLFVTDWIRDFLNAGESIPKDAVNAFALAQRDAFPSGHTQMALISLYLAHKYHLTSRYVLYFFGTLLIISTVYLRYHYVIDVAGGVVFMLFTVWTAPKVVSWWGKITSREVPRKM